MEKEYKTIEHEKPWRYETADGLTVTRGSAWSGSGCHLGCGVLLYTDKDGKLVKVDNQPTIEATTAAIEKALGLE